MQKQQINCYIDLDDTLTTTNTMLWSKIKFLTLLGYDTKDAFEKIKIDITPNNLTTSLLKKLCYKNVFILSRNTQDVVNLFIIYWDTLHTDITIIGGLGELSTKQKIEHANNIVLISDINEYKGLCAYPHFICNEQYLRYKPYIRKIKKIILLMYFLYCMLRDYLGKKSGFMRRMS